MSVTTTELAIAAVALAAVSLLLFVLAIRRLLSRQAEVTVTMLRRYDERLATFAQTLNDAIAAFQAPPALASPALEDDPEPCAEIANVCTGTGVTIAEVARTLMATAGRGVAVSHGPPRGGDIRQSVGDPRHAASLLGFKAQTSFAAGLDSTYGALRLPEAC